MRTQTRQELKDGLENEIQTFGQDRELSGGVLIAWNHTEFSITYNSLAEEIKIGDYFLRLLLTNDDGDADDSPIYRSAEFFSDLYHRFLLTPKAEMKCLCLQAMAIVYGRHHQDIGCFHDTKYIVAMLERVSPVIVVYSSMSCLMILMPFDAGFFFPDSGQGGEGSAGDVLR